MMMALNGQIEEGLDFILGHFSEPIFPRTISTAATYGAQVLVYSKEEALARFEAANLLDCRINAYPAFTQYKEINRQAPNFIFIDLDRSDFTTEKLHALALERTLKNIRDLGSEPTVLWSGNGYHVYLPINAFVLEQEEVFTKFDQPSKRFLRFAARHLSNYKSDPNNNLSLKSSMVRIPGSINSKRITKSEVKIIQKWDRNRLRINYLLRDFRRYLIDQSIRELREQNERRKAYQSYRCNTTSVQWIERLLLTPIPDYRKLTMWRILVPYLINRKHLSGEQCTNTIVNWLVKCGKLSRLEFNANYITKYAIKHVGTYGPVHPDKMKQELPQFYDLLLKYGVLTV